MFGYGEQMLIVEQRWVAAVSAKMFRVWSPPVPDTGGPIGAVEAAERGIPDSRVHAVAVRRADQPADMSAASPDR